MIPMQSKMPLGEALVGSGKITEERLATTLQNQLASSAHGGSGDARGSATTGDAQSERRGDPRGSGQQGAPGDDRNNGKPKSDGGIYA